jgi:hypothetical protein
MSGFLAELIQRYGGACLCCGADKDLVSDHVVPSALGGSDTLENLQLLCRRCNTRKGRASIDYRCVPTHFIAPKPAPKRKRIATVEGSVVLTIRIPKSLHERLSAAAESEYRSLNRHIIRCLELCPNGTPPPPNRLPGGGMLTAESAPDEPTNDDGEFRYPQRREG